LRPVILLGEQKYGYVMKQAYSTTELHQAKANPTLILRGPDLLLYTSAKTLGFNPKLQVVFRNMWGNVPDWGVYFFFSHLL
jgi:hypothetical protein